MNTASYTFDIITPMFIGGADPSQCAELRAPSIRGQLRWWFRVLGGFKSLAPMPVATQESMIFGSVTGGCAASKLIVRVNKLNSQLRRDADGMGASMLSAKGYLLFPLRSNKAKGEDKSRGVIEAGCFDLAIQWRGEARCWSEIEALISVFGHLGSLGFRSRRGWGAVASRTGMPLQGALERFGARNGVVVRTIPSSSADDALNHLGTWLRSWRAHGRSQDHAKGRPDEPPNNPGFRFAKADHDAGYRQNRNGPTYRPALGLPIVQRCQNGTHSWEATASRGEGRFASPILLRPHRDAHGSWHALVIFVDARKWAAGRQVYLDGQQRTVSLDLYHAMQADPRLRPFSG